MYIFLNFIYLQCKITKKKRIFVSSFKVRTQAWTKMIGFDVSPTTIMIQPWKKPNLTARTALTESTIILNLTNQAALLKRRPQSRRRQIPALSTLW